MLDWIRFVATEVSRRPQMAVISFTREILHGSSESLTENDQNAPRRKGPRLVNNEEDHECTCSVRRPRAVRPRAATAGESPGPEDRSVLNSLGNRCAGGPFESP